MTAQNAVISLLAEQKRPIYPLVALITSPFGPGGWSVAVSAWFSNNISVFFKFCLDCSITSARNGVIFRTKALLAKQKRPINPLVALTSPFDPGGWSVAVSAWFSNENSSDCGVQLRRSSSSVYAAREEF
jgi:hypothetical protein